MSNFAKQIEAAANDETIRGIVVSYEADYHEPPRPRPAEMAPFIPVELTDKVLTWRKAKPYLNREIDTGYGSVSCYAIYAWTDTRVLFVSTYDGSSYVTSLPRNPTDGRAHYSGGG